MSKIQWHGWQTRDGGKAGTQDNEQFWLVVSTEQEKKNYPPYIYGEKQLIPEYTQPLFLQILLLKTHNHSPK